MSRIQSELHDVTLSVKPYLAAAPGAHEAIALRVPGLHVAAVGGSLAWRARIRLEWPAVSEVTLESVYIF